MASNTSAGSNAPLNNLEKAETHEDAISRSPRNVQYDGSANDPGHGPQKPTRERSKWKFWKQYHKGQKTRWWFASTAIPLLAATLGPLANVSSISALVSYWRETIIIDGEHVSDFNGEPFADPDWCYWLNAASLICGFLGNFFLLLNFTQRIRYLIALPATIILWYISTGFLIAVTISIELYDPPIRPQQTYTQAFWYAVVAAVLYLVCSMLLMVNMLGYFLGRYPDTFRLTDAQRTLILQTMLFFIWLAGGAGIFSYIEQRAGSDSGWGFSDALYFCDVTILTVGFGDLYPTTDLSRGLALPYSVVGIIILSLVISSIYRFMRQLGFENIIQKHVNKSRHRTLERTVTNSFDLRHREHEVRHLIRRREGISKGRISGPIDGRILGIPVRSIPQPLQRVANEMGVSGVRGSRKPRTLVLRESHDRFMAMRAIQDRTAQLKKWYAVSFSLIAFGILWCIGAVVFWQCEKDAQGMSYFQALYFCYISLLTIGYGDLSPKSNPGRCFFVIWSLIAVPTMTILVSDMGDTVVDKFKTWSSALADFTVLPKEGVYRMMAERVPWLWRWVKRRREERRVRRGFEVEDPETAQPEAEDRAQGSEHEDENEAGPVTAGAGSGKENTNSTPKRRHSLNPDTPSALATSLSLTIQRVATDLASNPHQPKPKRYSYEEWVEFTRLIRLSSKTAARCDEEEEEHGLVEWDWIGDDSPLISGVSESQWVLGKLCEALVRVERARDVPGDWKGKGKERGGDDVGSDEKQTQDSGVAEEG